MDYLLIDRREERLVDVSVSRGATRRISDDFLVVTKVKGRLKTLLVVT